MKVLVMHGGYDSGIAGGETMAALLARELLDQSNEVLLAVDGQGEPVPPSPPWVPDVVHAFDLVCHEFARVGRELATRAGAVFALTPASAPELWGDPLGGAELCRGADVVFALSTAEAAKLAAAGTDPGRILVVGQGPRLEGAPRPEMFMERRGLAAPWVLFLGRRLISKGYGELLAAAPTVWRTMPATSFAFAGPTVAPKEEPNLAGRADGRLVDLGVLDEPEKHAALLACDIVCLPTRMDVFPLVLVEAWHCRKPVVCGRFDGVGAVVRDGIDGIVVESRADAVADALLRLLGDESLRMAMGRAGWERARRELTWEAVAARVVEGYREAARRIGSGS